MSRPRLIVEKNKKKNRRKQIEDGVMEYEQRYDEYFEDDEY